MTARHVVVVGGGNAGLCAALSAANRGAMVTLIERAPYAHRGGDSMFAAGAMRVAYESVEDIVSLVPDLSESDLKRTDFGIYTQQQFFDDLARVTRYRANPDLAAVLTASSLPTLQWMHSLGVRFMPIYGRQAFEIDGRFTFWGGLTVEVNGGGPGLIGYLERAAKRLGVTIRYDARVVALRTGHTGVEGVVILDGLEEQTLVCDAVVLAAGGFQANAEWRTRYLGPTWDLAKVRGTSFNTGDGIRMALDIGASSAGHWSGCHAVQWDLNAPEFGDREVGDGFQKHSYPWGIVVNIDGRRFIDEGLDYRNYTYAMYGRRVLEQPDQMAWQVFDDKTSSLLRDEYRIRRCSKVESDTLAGLAAKLDGIDQEQFLSTVQEYNAAIDPHISFNPNTKDGKKAVGLSPPKSNWATSIDTPPFRAFPVTCGVTFTFGGVRITPNAEVVDASMTPIPGLYAAGEMVGGLFYFNYPGGSGLTAGAVFGCRAGAAAGSAR